MWSGLSGACLAGRRALDLVYALVNEGNIKTLTRELLEYLKAADAEFRPDLTAKICLLVQRFAPSKQWQFDSLLEVRRAAAPAAQWAARTQPVDVGLDSCCSTAWSSQLVQGVRSGGATHHSKQTCCCHACPLNEVGACLECSRPTAVHILLQAGAAVTGRLCAPWWCWPSIPGLVVVQRQRLTAAPRRSCCRRGRP